eukprot:TRINITY_DN18014_c0_g1_i1.p1 TRINITY_DN18014_c0_g1~~TRINITY_DN18014_c0_g1_i1.p1  ORF type:complete len:181 (+),score=57.04 TRINITY_DN18014_c0_g1_i1:48-590(+)
MFRKFSKEDVANSNQLKSSAQRNIKNAILKKYPHLNPYINDIWPKKGVPVMLVKCHNYSQLVTVGQEAIFFSVRDGEWAPTIRLLHKYPFILPKFQVDKGAIRSVLSGAQIMCPGLTSPGGAMDDVDANVTVAIMAEGKEHALGIGFTKKSTNEIRTVNKDIGVDNLHYLNDGLWRVDRI